MLKKRERKIPVGTRVSNRKYPDLTLEQGLEMVVEAKRSEGVRQRTIDSYTLQIRFFSGWLRKEYPEVTYIGDISTQHVRDHINYMKHDAVRYEGHKFISVKDQGIGLADTTINIRIRAMKAIFNQLLRDGLIEYSPLDSVKLIRQDVDLTNCFTDSEVKAILAEPDQKDYVGYRDYVGIVLLLDSGCRITELLNLRVSEIDFQARFIALPGERTKNRKPRLVPISAHSVKLLLQLISENKEHFSTDRVFMSCFGEPLGANHFNKRLKLYAKRAGVEDKKLTAHVYRHTWAKNMILAGADPFTVQKMGGWSDIRTMRRYIQMDTSDVRASHDAHSPVNKFVKRPPAH